MLSEIDDSMVELCYEYGKNIGLAFQLMDDLQDFVSSSSIRGKPTAADLKLGLATAPVLFACEQVGVSVIFVNEYLSIDIRTHMLIGYFVPVSRIKRDDNAPFSRNWRFREGFRVSA